MRSGKKSSLKRGADMSSETDMLGSYTGVSAENEYEIPVQVADDL